MGGRKMPNRALCLGAALLAACSALIDADKDRLGGATVGAPGGGTTACGAGCAAGQRCNAAQGCVPVACRTDLDCNDGSPCNGVETCAPGTAAADLETGCVAGSAPHCDDGIVCTIDACDPAGNCVHTANDTLCDDGIDCTNDACSAAALPGTDGCVRTPEHGQCGFCHGDGLCSPAAGGCAGTVPKNCGDGDACTRDACDDVNGMCVHDVRDDDGDGDPRSMCGGGDCDDQNASVHSGASEVCDGEDDNCNGKIDEGCRVVPDACAMRQVVSLVNGHGELQGALSDFASDYSTACGQSGGRDAVYAIPVSGPSDIVIDSEGSAARVALALAVECVDGGFNYGCAGGMSPNAKRSRLMVHGYPASGSGDMLFLLIDGATAGETGSFRVSIDVTPAAPDVCGSDTFDLGICGTLIGYVSNLVGQDRGACQPGTGHGQPESILRAIGPRDKSVSVGVTSDEFVPALYARDGCRNGGSSDELGCAFNGDSGAPPGGGRADLNLAVDANKDFYLYVDGGALGDRYTLTCAP